MKKILIVNSFYYPNIVGGAEISTKILAESLVGKYEVHVITTGEHINSIEQDLINRVKVYRLPKSNIYSTAYKENRNLFQKFIWHSINNFNPVQAKLIKKLIKEIKPDIVHTHNLAGIGTYIWDIAKNFSIPVIHTTRDYNLIESVKVPFFNNFLTVFNRSRSKSVDHVIGISEYILNKHIKFNLFNNSRSSVIHNVVNTKQNERKERMENSPLILGYFGRLEPDKGINTILNVMKRLSTSDLVRVNFCGTGSLVGEIKELSKKDNRINYLGKLTEEEVYKEMAKVDITIVPSAWDEPFGRVIIESFSQGTPVLATNIGGIPEILDEKFLFEKDAEEELVEKLLEIKNMSIHEYNKLVLESTFESKKYTSNFDEHLAVYQLYIT